MAKSDLSRRTLLKLGSASAAWALTASAAGCAGPLANRANREYLELPPAPEQGNALVGFYRKRDLREICEELIPQITDLAWLKPGDSVLIKVACNSGNEHPAVTWPAAVEAVVAFLKAREAGPVYIADQAGVGNARLTQAGRSGSTRELMRTNGLASAAEKSGALLHCFDEQGWDGYFAERPDWEDAWGGKLYLANLIRDVDHIVYLPRLGTHVLAGYTCGIKNAVGFLRDDSRKTMHQKGATFFEKIAEINHAPAIRNKFRFVLTLADKSLLNIGPDFGATYDLNGVMAVGSRRLVDHDYLASNALRWMDLQQLSILDVLSPPNQMVNSFNRVFVSLMWGNDSLKGYEDLTPYTLSLKLEYDRCISHLALLQKYRPQRIQIKLEGDKLPGDLTGFLAEAGAGIFAFG